MPFKIDLDKILSQKIIKRKIPLDRCSICVHYKNDNSTYPQGYCNKIKVAFHSHDPKYGIYQDCQKENGQFESVERYIITYSPDKSSYYLFKGEPKIEGDGHFCGDYSCSKLTGEAIVVYDSSKKTPLARIINPVELQGPHPMDYDESRIEIIGSERSARDKFWKIVERSKDFED